MEKDAKKNGQDEPKPSPKESRIPRSPSQTNTLAIKAPLPGTIITVLVKPGDRVRAGETVIAQALKEEKTRRRGPWARMASSKARVEAVLLRK